jgi:hypothetical protein
MAHFFDDDTFDPTRDGKVPQRRSPIMLCLRLLQHMSRMLFSRHPGDLFKWLKSMVLRRKPLRYAMPWLTFDAIRAIEQKLGPGQRVFEYGSGHSTVYWSQQGVELYSVEDDAAWFAMVKDRLAGVPGTHLYFEQGMQDYVGRIDKCPGIFDIVLVDGSFRKDCMLAGMPKLKPGGLLVVDNTDWHWMQKVFPRMPDDWKVRNYPGCAPFIGHVSQTTIWVKP